MARMMRCSSLKTVVQRWDSKMALLHVVRHAIHTLSSTQVLIPCDT